MNDEHNWAYNLFAGSGGWEWGARLLPLTIVGVENDEDTIATRAACGYNTLPVDVREVSWEGSNAPGLIASPPCPEFSSGGGQAALTELDKIIQTIDSQKRDYYFETAGAELVMEPYRVIMERAEENPWTWIIMEQVPQALPVWEAYARLLKGWGYNVDFGVIDCAHFGTPQYRRRAIFMAHLYREVSILPGADPGRNCMAEACSWSSGYVGFPRKDDRGDGIIINGKKYRRRDMNYTANRSATVTSKARSWKRLDLLTNRVYPIEVHEAALLQTFPMDYPWQGSKTSQFQQIANAIPPVVAESLLERLI